MQPTGLEPWQEDLLLAGLPTVVAENGAVEAHLSGSPPGATRVTVVAPDRPGLLATVAGVLLVHRLEVRTVSAQTRDGTAVQVWRVVAPHGDRVDAARLRDDALRAMDGRLDVAARVAARLAAADRPLGSTSRRLPVAAPRVDVAAGVSQRATVVEVRAHDTPGLLYRLTSAVAAARVSIATAVVGTLGAEAVDAFYLVDHRGRPPSAALTAQVVAALRAAAG